MDHLAIGSSAIIFWFWRSEAYLSANHSWSSCFSTRKTCSLYYLQIQTPKSTDGGEIKGSLVLFLYAVF